MQASLRFRKKTPKKLRRINNGTCSDKKEQGAVGIQTTEYNENKKQKLNSIQSCGLQHLRNRPAMQKHSRGGQPSNAVSSQGRAFISPDNPSTRENLSQEGRNSVLRNSKRRRTRRYEQSRGPNHCRLD